GLSGAGKSTTAEVLTALLLERGRQVTVLDGDVVRTLLSKGLGFSREDRDLNIRRIAFVASEVVRHGGLVIVSAVSPYRATRDEARALIGADRFVEVFVDTPLEECERRDVKGIYAQARRGEIANFTGISDPYEPPLAPEIRLDTVAATAEANARRILEYLIAQGFVRSDADADAADLGPAARDAVLPRPARPGRPPLRRGGGRRRRRGEGAPSGGGRRPRDRDRARAHPGARGAAAGGPVHPSCARVPARRPGRRLPRDRGHGRSGGEPRGARRSDGAGRADQRGGRPAALRVHPAVGAPPGRSRGGGLDLGERTRARRPAPRAAGAGAGRRVRPLPGA